MHAVIQYHASKNGQLLFHSIYLLIALFSFRFFIVFAIHSFATALEQALLPKELVPFIAPLYTSFYHPTTLDIIDTIFTFIVLAIIVLGSFGRKRKQLQNELEAFLRLKRDAKRMEKNVHRQSSYIRLLEIVSKIKKMLIESSTEKEIFTHVCNSLGTFPHYKVVWIGLQSEENNIVNIAYKADMATPSYLQKNFQIKLDDDDPHAYGPVGECMRTGRSVLIEDTQSDPRFEPWKYRAKASSIHSVLSIPIKTFHQKKLFGVISIYGDAEHSFSYEEIDILEDLAQNVSSAIAYHKADNHRKETEDELKNSSQLLQNIIATVPVRIFWKDKYLYYRGCNALFLQDADLSRIEDIVGKKDTDLVWAEHADAFIQDDLQVMKTKNPIVNRVERQGDMYVLVNKAPLFDNEHNIIGMIGSYTDITLQRKAELYLKENEQRFRELIQSLPNISIQGYDKDRKVIYWNRQSEILYGYSEEDALGRKFEELIIPEAMRDRVIADIENWIHNNKPIPASELTLRKKDGSDVLVYSSHVLLRSQEKEPEIFCIDIDLTQQKEAELALERLANHDLLTQLPNRHFFLRHAKALINKAERNHSEFALLFLDLDDFKVINDTYGHDYGDNVLIEAAERLRSSLRDYDFVARYGGDEFIVTIEYEGDIELIMTIAQKIIDTLKEPIYIKNTSLQIGSSVGISLYPQDSSELLTLLKYADAAMYSAKEGGKNRFSHYSNRSL
ncbi:diguanylate cyclase [Sulfurimonas sp. HSL3-7]|uniref:sensor domain-containing diguanylate cyclase n=1 Tax=Sulfonitrofixus jiaomeiensis TaxID=3131938 RepID=UPI0031F917E4